MLEPQHRRLLLESLRPPDGHRFDRAIGTTFSLDLLALLTAPLAFTLFGSSDDEGSLASNPMALLESLRRHADRISLFCQAGQIAPPSRQQLLFGYLEQSVFEVSPRNPQRVFHPKVWLLRFVAGEGLARYRLLVLSRNLTFDHSWDTALVLDGEIEDRSKPFQLNRPLIDFFAALPDLAVRPLPDRVKADIALIMQELGRVRFEPPEGFGLRRFWPLGLKGEREWPFTGRIDRLLIVSPFVSKGFLERVARKGENHVLVSRQEALDSVDRKTLKPFAEAFILSPTADGEPDETEEPTPLAGKELLAGLHAKLYVADAGWNAAFWTGSANATEAAFDGNIEFLVELDGSKKDCGIDALLGRVDGETRFGDLLLTYSPPEEAAEKDEAQADLDRRAEEARRLVARARLAARVSARENEETFTCEVRTIDTDGPLINDDVALRCWPITLPEALAMTVSPGANPVARFDRLSFEALTSFFAFDLLIVSKGRTASLRFVLNLPLEGVPADRKERLLRSLLRDREHVLRYLQFLLAEGDLDGMGAIEAAREIGETEGGRGTIGPGAPLFEAMVRALDRSPARIDEIARLVEDLRRASSGTDLLPEGFDTVWRPIWSARERLKS